MKLSNCGAGEDSWESFRLQRDQPINLKGNQLWTFVGRTDAKAETPLFWPPNVKSQLTGKDPDAGKGWRQKKKGTKGWDGEIASPTQWTWIWANSSD